MPQVIGERTKDVGGIETHYFEAGTGEPLVLLHGGGPGVDAWGNWQYLIHPLLTKGFRVFAMDLVGFGQTEAPDPDTFDYSRENIVQHVHDFITKLDLDDPTLLGQSFGGSVALGAAVEDPDPLGKLVLFGPSARSIAESDNDDAEETLDLDRLEMIEFARSMSATGQVDFEAIVDRRLENWDRPGVPDAYNAIWETLRAGGLVFEDDEIAAIPNETFIFQGRNDVHLDFEHAWQYMNLVEDSSLYVLNDAGHWEMVDRVEEVAATVTRFVRR
jgi:2-hydroxy-6-oxo-6-(2'-aminophenyl)hexa-2,4-dienoate hydrolase